MRWRSERTKKVFTALTSISQIVNSDHIDLQRSQTYPYKSRLISRPQADNLGIIPYLKECYRKIKKQKSFIFLRLVSILKGEAGSCSNITLRLQTRIITLNLALRSLFINSSSSSMKMGRKRATYRPIKLPRFVLGLSRRQRVSSKNEGMMSAWMAFHSLPSNALRLRSYSFTKAALNNWQRWALKSAICIRGFARSRCWLGESLISLPVNENRREENNNNQPETVGIWGISRPLDLPYVKRQIAEMEEVQFCHHRCFWQRPAAGGNEIWKMEAGGRAAHHGRFSNCFEKTAH